MKNYLMFALLLLAASGMAFGQTGVAEPHTTAPCPGERCHIAPFFMGEGGFVAMTMEDEIEFTVHCGSVFTTVPATPDANGIVRELFTMDNGLACSDGGLLTVHDVEDGGWYWIHDQDNAAVSPLIASDILGNANNVMPLNPGGVTVLETSDYASYVRHEPSGRVGIMNRILPVPDMECETPALCLGYVRHDNCLLDSTWKLSLHRVATNNEDGNAVTAGSTVYREDSENERNTVRVVLTGNGFIRTAADVSVNMTLLTATDSGINARALAGVTPAVNTADPGANRGTEPPDDDAKAGRVRAWDIVIEDEVSAGEICHADSTDKRPQKVRVTAAFADLSGVVPTGEIEHVEFFIACAKPASSSTQGVDLIPDNPFPTDE